MRKKRVLIISVIIVVLIAISLLLLYKSNLSLINITSSKFQEILRDNEEKLIYVGRPTCPGCEEIKPILEEELKEQGVKAYYYNTDKAKKENMDSFNEIKEELGIKYVPVVIYYKGNIEIKRVEEDDYRENNNALTEIIEQYKSSANLD